jgi:hypothetical protein
MLLALGWISIGYAASLFVGRSDLRSETNRKIINATVALAMFSVIAFVAIRLRQDMSWSNAIDVSQSPLVRTVFLPASIATAIVVNGVYGNEVLSLAAALCSVGIIGLAFAAATTQVGWLYDQAAAKGINAINLRNMRRGGNPYAISAERARQGKIKRGRLAAKFSGLSMQGPPSLLWKDLLLQLRSSLAGASALGLICMICLGSVAYAVKPYPNYGAEDLLILICGMWAYMFGLTTGVAGFREMLARIDLLKPLPLTTSQIMFWEVVAKVPLPTCFLAAGVFVAGVVDPHAIAALLAGVIVSVPLMVVFLSTILFSMVLFPDYEDPTQRGLSGLVMLLAIAIGCSIPVGTFVVLSYVLKIHPIVAAIPSGVSSILISLGLATISGNLFAGFNPTD